MQFNKLNAPRDGLGLNLPTRCNPLTVTGPVPDFRRSVTGAINSNSPRLTCNRYYNKMLNMNSLSLAYSYGQTNKMHESKVSVCTILWLEWLIVGTVLGIQHVH